MRDKVEGVLDKIRPSLMADGGNVELVGVNDGTVQVRLTGACGGCPMATMTLKMGIEKLLKEEIPEVGEEAIAHIVSKWTGIPLIRLEEKESARLLKMEDELHKRIVGQEEAMKAIAQAIRRSRAGISPRFWEVFGSLPR